MNAGDKYIAHDSNLLPGFNMQLYLLSKGFKKVIKKEHVKTGDCGALIAGYEKLGLNVIMDPDAYYVDSNGNFTSYTNSGDGYNTLIIGSDAAAAARAFELHKMGGGEDALRNSVTRRLGRLLGYPECCIDFFALLEDKKNTGENTLNILFNTKGVLNPLLNTVTGFPLIEHFSCSFNCRASLKIARATLRGITETLGAEAAGTLTAQKLESFIFFDSNNIIYLGGRLDGGVFRYGKVRRKNGPDDLFNMLLKGDSCSFGKGGIIIYKDGAILREGARGGCFFNWGERNNYYRFISPGADVIMVKRINDIFLPMLADGVDGWFFSRIEMADDHIFIFFEKPEAKDSFKLTLKKRNDAEGSAARSLNFNIILPRVAGRARDLGSLVHAVSLLMHERDNEAIPAKVWNELFDILSKGSLIWKNGKIIRSAPNE